MSYAELYERVQRQSPKVSTKWLRDEVISLTHINIVREQWTGLISPEDLRGFYIEGPIGPPVPLEENEALIGLAREITKPMRRIVYAKELMHAFDTDEEKTDSEEKFDVQVERLSDPNKEMSPQFRAEAKALWRALAALCPENFRQEQIAALDRGETTISMIAATLAIPDKQVHNLFRSDFDRIIEGIKG